MRRGEVTRRSFLRRVIKSLLGAATLITLPLGYSYRGERFWYRIKEVNLSFSRLPKAFHGLKLVQFSDVHLGHYFDERHMLDIVNRINALQPDLICFTGDLVELDTSVLQASIPALTKLKAPLGKWAVPGNHDYRGDIYEVVDGLEQAGFSVLINKNKAIEFNGQSITMAGVDDQLSGHPDVAKAIQGVRPNQFTILLSHTPDYADIASDYPIDIQLSGHSHGGQICLPFFGAIVTPQGAKKYKDGLYRVENSKMKVYVNKGVGTTVLPLRFACRPEITLFTFSTPK